MHVTTCVLVTVSPRSSLTSVSDNLSTPSSTMAPSLGARSMKRMHYLWLSTAQALAFCTLTFCEFLCKPSQKSLKKKLSLASFRNRFFFLLKERSRSYSFLLFQTDAPSRFNLFVPLESDTNINRPSSKTKRSQTPIAHSDIEQSIQGNLRLHLVRDHVSPSKYLVLDTF